MAEKLKGQRERLRKNSSRLMAFTSVQRSPPTISHTMTNNSIIVSNYPNWLELVWFTARFSEFCCLRFIYKKFLFIFYILTLLNGIKYSTLWHSDLEVKHSLDL